LSELKNDLITNDPRVQTVSKPIDTTPVLVTKSIDIFSDRNKPK